MLKHSNRFFASRKSECPHFFTKYFKWILFLTTIPVAIVCLKTAKATSRMHLLEWKIIQNSLTENAELDFFGRKIMHSKNEVFKKSICATKPRFYTFWSTKNTFENHFVYVSWKLWKNSVVYLKIKLVFPYKYNCSDIFG